VGSTWGASVTTTGAAVGAGGGWQAPNTSESARSNPSKTFARKNLFANIFLLLNMILNIGPKTGAENRYRKAAKVVSSSYEFRSPCFGNVYLVQKRFTLPFNPSSYLSLSGFKLLSAQMHY